MGNGIVPKENKNYITRNRSTSISPKQILKQYWHTLEMFIQKDKFEKNSNTEQGKYIDNKKIIFNWIDIYSVWIGLIW